MRIRINNNVKELIVGDEITTDYYSNEKMIVRKITEILEDKEYESDRKVKFDGGEKCSCCGHVKGTPLDKDYVDAGWAIPYKK